LSHLIAVTTRVIGIALTVTVVAPGDAFAHGEQILVYPVASVVLFGFMADGKDLAATVACTSHTCFDGSDLYVSTVRCPVSR
jgi:hypothetical protein